MDPDRWRVAIAPEVKSMFGRPLRVLIASWFLANDLEVAQLHDVNRAMAPYGEVQSGVSAELRRFVKQGMLNEVADKNRVYFVPAPSPLWEVYGLISGIFGVHFDRTTDKAARHPHLAAEDPPDP